MVATTAPSKTRSPNYPVLSLGEAIQRLRVIYDKQRRYPTTREVLAQLLGYGGINGASATILSTLGKYGLLEGQGEQLRVSEMGQDLILHRKGDPEYDAALRAAAFKPILFRELREQYPNGLPSEHSLRAVLIKRGFSPRATDTAIRAYRDTISLVSDEVSAPYADLDDLTESEVAMMTQAQTGGYASPERSWEGRSPIVPTMPEVAQRESPAHFSWPLTGNLVAEVAFRGADITPEDIDTLQDYLNIAKRALARRTPLAPALPPAEAPVALPATSEGVAPNGPDDE